MVNKKNKKGFTLIEVLIYTAIMGITGTILSGVLLNATKIKGKQTAVIEVNNQLNFALQNIQRSIMDSSVIDITNSVSTSTLVLKFKDDNKNPTKFYATDGILYKKEGLNTAEPVTDSNVVVDAVNFLKVSGYSGHDSVQIDLTLRYNSLSPDSSFSKTLSSAIARVSAATFDSNLIPGTNNFYDIGISSTKWKDMYLSGSMYLTETASKLGIGTVSPSARIHNLIASRATTFSAGDGTTWHDVIIQNPNNTLNAATGIVFELNPTYHTNAGTGIAAVKSTASSDYGADMVFVTRPQSAAATEKMRITSAGNVGIGTTIPGAKLAVKDGSIHLDETNGLFFFSTDGGTVGTSVASFIGRADTAGYHVTSTDGGFASLANSFIIGSQAGPLILATTDAGSYPSGRMIIDANGRVGIGIAAPEGALHVFASGSAADTVGGGIILNRHYNGAADQRGGAIFNYYATSAAQDLLVFGVSQDTTPLNISKAKMVIGNNGNVGIGTVAPGQKLTVVGTIESTSGGFKLPDGNTLSSLSYAQLERSTYQDFPGNAWTGVVFDGMPITNGITYSGANITFTKAGVYRITLGVRNVGADVWTAVRLYGDGASKGHSGGFGSSAPNPTHVSFLANITNIATTYQVQIGRLTSATSIATPSAIAGETPPSIQVTLEKIN